MTTKYLFLLALVFGLASCQSINAVVEHSGVSYAFDGYPFLSGPESTVPHAYQITNGVITNTYDLSGTTGTHIGSAFVAGNSLYQFSGAYGVASLSKYTLPFASTTPEKQLEFASHLMIPAIVDATDGIAVAIVTRNINLVDLNTFTITSTSQAIVGSRKSAGALVYNHDTNRIYFFINHYCAWGDCQHIQEYDATNNVLTKLSESFSPDYNTGFNNGYSTGCQLDYQNNNIWCLNANNAQLQRFSVSDLNVNSILALPASTYTGGNVQFDFANQKAYVIADETSGFTVYEISLVDGSVVRQCSFSNPIPVISVSLDLVQGKLFLGHDNVDSKPELSTIDLASFTVSSLEF